MYGWTFDALQVQIPSWFAVFAPETRIVQLPPVVNDMFPTSVTVESTEQTVPMGALTNSHTLLFGSVHMQRVTRQATLWLDSVEKKRTCFVGFVKFDKMN